MFESLPVKASRRNRYGTGLAGSMVQQSALTGLLSGQCVASKWAPPHPHYLKIGFARPIDRKSSHAAINTRLCLVS
jgi:hypothetical protein